MKIHTAAQASALREFFNSRPICDVCNRPVDEIRFHYGLRGLLNGSLTFEVRCHGSRETTTLTENDLRVFDQAKGLQWARSFVKPKR